MPSSREKLTASMEPLPDISSLDRMNRLEKIRFLAEVSARSAIANAELEMARAQGEAIALRMGGALLALEGDRLVWRGQPLECLLTDEREAEDDDVSDDDETTDEDEVAEPWPVNIESDLLERVRTVGFDLGELLDEHCHPRKSDDLVRATVTKLDTGEWIAAFTTVDMDALKETTYVFSLDRQPNSSRTSRA